MFFVYMFYVRFALKQSLGFRQMAPHQEILRCWLCLEKKGGKEVPRMHSSQVDANGGSFFAIQIH